MTVKRDSAIGDCLSPEPRPVPPSLLCCSHKTLAPCRHTISQSHAQTKTQLSLCCNLSWAASEIALRQIQSTKSALGLHLLLRSTLSSNCSTSVSCLVDLRGVNTPSLLTSSLIGPKGHRDPVSNPYPPHPARTSNPASMRHIPPQAVQLGGAGRCPSRCVQDLLGPLAGTGRIKQSRSENMQGETDRDRTILGTGRAWKEENLARSSCNSLSTCLQANFRLMIKHCDSGLHPF